MKQIKIWTLVVLCLLSVNAVAGEKEGEKKPDARFHIELSYAHDFLFSQHIGGESYDGVDKYSNTLTLEARYSITPRVAVGAGWGLKRCEYLGMNTMPLYATVHYTPLPETLRGLYAYTDLGAGIKFSDDYDAGHGFLMNIGVGYTHMFSRHFGLNVKAGYALQQVTNVPVNYTEKKPGTTGENPDDWIFYTRNAKGTMHGFQLAFGVVF